jgi:5-methylcytosine-specific restriction protein A
VVLSDISRDAVLKAIAEYDSLGQDGFLERYGFDRARQYLLVHDGKRYDSKAIVGAAHGFLPEEHPLTAGEFSGGEATVGRLLRRLGFTVQVGEALSGDRLVRLLSKLQVYRRDGLPALYQPITLLWAFGRAFDDEQRLVSWAETRRQVSGLFDRCGRPWEGDRVYYPIAALQMISEQGGLTTAKQLLWSSTPSEGFTTLWERGRLDLTVEAHVLKTESATLFTDDDRDQARDRLEAYGWRPLP